MNKLAFITGYTHKPAMQKTATQYVYGTQMKKAVHNLSPDFKDRIRAEVGEELNKTQIRRGQGLRAALDKVGQRNGVGPLRMLEIYMEG